eukprot:GSA25T00009306001.1
MSRATVSLQGLEDPPLQEPDEIDSEELVTLPSPREADDDEQVEEQQHPPNPKNTTSRRVAGGPARFSDYTAPPPASVALDTVLGGDTMNDDEVEDAPEDAMNPVYEIDADDVETVEETEQEFVENLVEEDPAAVENLVEQDHADSHVVEQGGGPQQEDAQPTTTSSSSKLDLHRAAPAASFTPAAAAPVISPQSSEGTAASPADMNSFWSEREKNIRGIDVPTVAKNPTLRALLQERQEKKHEAAQTSKKADELSTSDATLSSSAIKKTAPSKLEQEPAIDARGQGPAPHDVGTTTLRGMLQEQEEEAESLGTTEPTGHHGEENLLAAVMEHMQREKGEDDYNVPSGATSNTNTQKSEIMNVPAPAKASPL